MRLPPLDTKRLVLVLGKGGVGRTTVAAALAIHLARTGRKTLLYQANHKERLGSLLGGPPVGEDLVHVRGNLWAINPTPRAALHEYGLMVLRYETIYRMVFENRVTRSLVHAIPGVEDYSLLGKLWYHTTELEGGRPRWDTIVLDAPATGHAVTMLKIPQAILDAVPEGPLTRDAVKVRALLLDPSRSAAVVVTLAEEMPVNETIDITMRLRDEVKMQTAGVIVNQLYPDRFARDGAAARALDALGDDAARDGTLGPLVKRARMLRARRELHETYLERLRRELPLPTAHLPMVFAASMGPEAVDALSERLAAQLEPGGRS